MPCIKEMRKTWVDERFMDNDMDSRYGRRAARKEPPEEPAGLHWAAPLASTALPRTMLPVPPSSGIFCSRRSTLSVKLFSLEHLGRS